MKKSKETISLTAGQLKAAQYLAAQVGYKTDEYYIYRYFESGVMQLMEGSDGQDYIYFYDRYYDSIMLNVKTIKEINNYTIQKRKEDEE